MGEDIKPPQRDKAFVSTSTRCPSCKTRFRVTDVQLKAAKGWVRCGTCHDIFDATLTLRRRAANGNLVPVPAVDGKASGTASAQSDNAAGVEQPAVRVRSAESERSRNPAAARTNERKTPRSEAPSPAPKEPEFVIEARRRAWWSRPAVRNSLLGSCCLLGVGLIAQVAMHHRNRLALVYPPVQPYLAAVCHWAACDVGPWQHIEALRIDSATLQKEQGTDHRLEVVLMNTHPLDIATPHLELTLTDSREQLLVRKVFTPAEMQVNARVPGGGQIKVMLPLQLQLANGQVMAGYLTRIFYP